MSRSGLEVRAGIAQRGAVKGASWEAQEAWAATGPEAEERLRGGALWEEGPRAVGDCKEGPVGASEGLRLAQGSDQGRKASEPRRAKSGLRLGVLLSWAIASVVFHALALLVFNLTLPFLSPEPRRTKTRPVSLVVLPPEEEKEKEEIKEEEQPKFDGQLVDTPKPDEEKRPEEADYLAEHDNTVLEETRSEEYRLNPEVLAPKFSEADEVKMEEAVEMNVTEQSTGAQVGNDRFDPDRDGPMAAVPSPFAMTNRDGLQKPVMAASRTSAIAGAPNNDLLREKVGAETQLNTREVIGASYLNRIRRLVNFFWDQNLNNIDSSVRLARPSYTTVVDVVLDRNGALEKITVSTPCGSEELDEAVVSAFRVAGPFPNPPSQLIDPDGKIRLPQMGFTVELGRGRPTYMGVDPRAGVQFPGILKAPR